MTDLLIDHDNQHLIADGFKISSHGYVRVKKPDGRWEYLHRIVLPDAHRVDHKNRNKLDNRRQNLRRATQSDNGCNRGKASHNSSGFKGVYFCKYSGRWRSEIRHQNKVRKLGRFDTAIAAAIAYDNAALELHGEFAVINFPNSRSA